MNMRLLRYPTLATLIVGGLLIAAPPATHATYQSVGTCTTGTAPTMLGGLQAQVKGATNYALPVSPDGSTFTTTTTSGTTTVTVTTTTVSNVMTTTTTTSTGLITTTAAPVSAQDYGYLTSVNGLSRPFQPGLENAAGALLTYYASSSSLTDNMFYVPSSTRTGTLTIYAVTGQAGNFSQPTSFMSGTPVLTASYTQVNVGSVPFSSIGFALMGAQMNLTGSKGQTGIGQDFSSDALATVTSSTPFSLDGACYQLAAPGTTFVMHNVGHLASPTSPNGAYSGVWGSEGVM